MGGRFLGLGYEPQSDEVISRVAPVIRMTRKRSKQRRQNNELITEEWIENLRTGEHVLTKRRVLAFVMSQYDPHGMRAPMMLTAKLLLRKLYGASYEGGWDDPLKPSAARVGGLPDGYAPHGGYPDTPSPLYRGSYQPVDRRLLGWVA